MEITEVRIELIDLPAGGNKRLQGFASITIEQCLVIRDLKIVLGEKRRFVAMPSRKLTDKCSCEAKTPFRANFCSQCGVKLNGERAPRGSDGRAKLYADIIYPITTQCREMIESAVLRAYLAAVQRRLESAVVEFREGAIVTINGMTSEQLEAEAFKGSDELGEENFVAPPSTPLEP